MLNLLTSAINIKISSPNLSSLNFSGSRRIAWNNLLQRRQNETKFFNVTPKCVIKIQKKVKFIMIFLLSVYKRTISQIIRKFFKPARQCQFLDSEINLQWRSLDSFIYDRSAKRNSTLFIQNHWKNSINMLGWHINISFIYIKFDADVAK